MKVRRYVAMAVAAAALVGTAVTMPGSAQAACKRDITQCTTGSIQWATQLAARNKWRRDVRARHGGAYARWSKAINKTEECNRAPPGGRWSCCASAAPCN